MISLGVVTTPDRPCSYLPDRIARTQFELVAELSTAEYSQLMLDGWRRFGRSLFRPVCEGCHECKALRIDVKNFRPNQSQKRCRKANRDDIRLAIGTPEVTREKLALYAAGRNDPTGPMGAKEYMMSMDRYVGFVYSELIRQVLASPRLVG